MPLEPHELEAARNAAIEPRHIQQLRQREQQFFDAYRFASLQEGVEPPAVEQAIEKVQTTLHNLLRLPPFRPQVERSPRTPIHSAEELNCISAEYPKVAPGDILKLSRAVTVDDTDGTAVSTRYCIVDTVESYFEHTRRAPWANCRLFDRDAMRQMQASDGEPVMRRVNLRQAVVVGKEGYPEFITECETPK